MVIALGLNARLQFSARLCDQRFLQMFIRYIRGLPELGYPTTPRPPSIPSNTSSVAGLRLLSLLSLVLVIFSFIIR